MADEKTADTKATTDAKPNAPPRAKKTVQTSKAKTKAKSAAKRSRVARIYPALSFEESLPLPEAIQTHASGERVSRLTLLKAMNLSPTSSSTQILITTSAKYGLTKGSFVAEYLELTPQGKAASEKDSPPRKRAQARFELAIQHIKPFAVLYTKYQGKKLPAPEVMADALNEAKLEIADAKECIDTFVVNAKFVGLLQTIAGSETLVPITVLLEQLPTDISTFPPAPPERRQPGTPDAAPTPRSPTQWQKVCFYVTPIGDEGTELRKHSDLFLSSLIEPALDGFGLEVIRADKIGQPGMPVWQ